MRKVFCAVIGATVMAFAVATSAAEGNVSIGVPNWDYAKVISNVLKVISEERLGTQVSIVPATNPVAFRAMHRGKGDIDVHPDVWMPNQQSFTAEYVDQKKTVHLGEKHYLAEQGLCVFRSTRDTHGIRSVDDLANPEKAKLFDSNGDGKGEMWIGAPNWASTSIQKVKARDYGYGGLFELKVMEEDLAAIGDRRRSRERREHGVLLLLTAFHVRKAHHRAARGAPLRRVKMEHAPARR